MTELVTAALKIFATQATIEPLTGCAENYWHTGNDRATNRLYITLSHHHKMVFVVASCFPLGSHENQP